MTRNTPAKFWSLVDKRGPDDCWPWKGKLNKDGYAQFYWKGRLVVVSRIAFELSTEKDLPKGSPDNVVRHSCDNPPCCNPKHLMLGTQTDNIKDRSNRGRTARLESHPRAKLNWSKVRKIRSSTKPQIELARLYKVVPNVIWKIKHNRVWKETIT